MTNEELSQQLTELKICIGAYRAENSAQATITNSKLESIDTHLLKLNSKVASHEKQLIDLEVGEKTHETRCPQAVRIRVLEDNQLSTKAVKKWVIGSVSVTGVLMSILFIVIRLLTDI